MCVAMEQLENYVHLPYKPHLLVIPSDLRYFAKVSISLPLSLHYEYLLTFYKQGSVNMK